MTLTAQRLREFAHYNPETGLFARRRATGRWGRTPAGQVLGHVRPDGYVAFAVDGRNYLAHRLAWLYMHGAWPKEHIDHINGNRADNRIANLRDVSPAINCQNRTAPQSTSRTGVLGVGYSNGAIVANIKLNRRQIYLGQFGTIEQAKAAYDAAKRQLHPGFARC